jgi:hypothetical protein
VVCVAFLQDTDRRWLCHLVTHGIQPTVSATTGVVYMTQSSCNARCFRFTGSPKTSCFSLRHKRRCSAAKPEDIGFAGGDPIHAIRCRRCEPWFLAATSFSQHPESTALRRLRAHSSGRRRSFRSIQSRLSTAYPDVLKFSTKECFSLRRLLKTLSVDSSVSQNFIAVGILVQQKRMQEMDWVDGSAGDFSEVLGIGKNILRAYPKRPAQR